MSTVVVLIFLLDSFSDIKNATNKMSTLKMYNMNLGGLQLCNPETADNVIEIISKKINKTISINLEYFKDRNYELNADKSIDVFEDLSLDNFNKIDTFVDDSLLDTEKSLELVHNYLEDKNKDLESKYGYTVSENILKNSDIFSKSAPFLVAIFESLSNITAQTCAGTLLSPHWVVTSADCVDVLPTLYSNKTKSTEKSHYAIVVNSTDPFVDGAVHNVTKILFHPNNFSALELFTSNRNVTVKVNNQKFTKKPSLSLMRVEPPVIEGEPLEIMRSGLVGDKDVEVYGWILVKNESGQETIHMKSLQTKLVYTSECIGNQENVNPDSVFCFSSMNETKDILSQMSSGGPVLIRDNNRVRVLAVTQIDEQGSLRAYSLSKHSVWIENILMDDKTV